MRLIDADALKANVPETRADIFEDCRRCTTLMDWEVKELVDKQPTITAPRWHRVEEPPLPNQDLWLHDEHGYYHVGYISTHRGYTEYIDMDGNALHGIDYWMPIEPPKEGV